MPSLPVEISSPADPVAKLALPERTLLSAFRWWLTAESERDVAANEQARATLASLVGDAQSQVILGYYDILVRTVARHPARTLRYHPPCCPHATPDEVLLLAIIAACQGGHLAMAGSLVNLIVATEGVGAALDAASDLGLAILSGGVLLELSGRATSMSAIAALGLISLH